MWVVVNERIMQPLDFSFILGITFLGKLYISCSYKFHWYLCMPYDCYETVLQDRFECVLWVCLTLKITEYVFFFVSTSTKWLDFFHGPAQSSVKSMSFIVQNNYVGLSEHNQPVYWFCLTCWLYSPVSQFYCFHSF